MAGVYRRLLRESYFDALRALPMSCLSHNSWRETKPRRSHGRPCRAARGSGAGGDVQVARGSIRDSTVTAAKYNKWLCGEQNREVGDAIAQR